MPTNQTRKMTWRWVFLASFSTALFWGAWYFVNGFVPTTDGIFTARGNFWTPQQFPPISRWWDIAAMAIFGAIAAQLTILYQTKDDDVKEGLVAGLVTGLVVGLVVWQVVWLTFGPVFGLIIFGPVFGLAVWLAAGPVAWLTFGVAFGLTIGFPVGFPFGLVVGLVFVSIHLMFMLMRTLLSGRTSAWFMGR